MITDDYVLTLRFMKYVSDKYAGDRDALIEVPAGGGFADMVQLRGDKDIGDRINKIIGRLAEANHLKGVIDQADFNDESRLGTGKEMQDRLSKLVAISDGLDFRANRIRAAVNGEVQRLTQRLAARVQEREERYAKPLPERGNEVTAFSAKVEGHLKRVGLSV